MSCLSRPPHQYPPVCRLHPHINPFCRSLSGWSWRLKYLLLAAIFCAAGSAGYCAKSPVYTWDKQYYFNSKQGGNWSYTWETDSSGPLRCTYSTTTDLQGFHHMIFASANSAFSNSLQHGGIYTVDVQYYVGTAPVSPAYFYVLARNSLGNQYDILHKFNGDPSTTLQSVSFPIDLKTLPGGTWNVYMGIVGAGSLVMNSYVISEGSDETKTAAVSGGNPSNNATGITSAAGSSAVTITPPSGSGSLTVTGLIADSASAAEANAAAFTSSLNSAVSGGQHTLLIPSGRYWIAPLSGSTYVPLAISSKLDLTIDGQGSTFVFNHQTGDGSAISMSGNHRLVMKNLNLDWDWTVQPLASLGKVSNLTVGASTTSCDFTFEDLDATQTEKVRSISWGGLGEADPNTLSRTGTSPDISLTFTTGLTRTNNVIHATFNNSGTSSMANGKYYIIRHANYGMAAFKIYACDNILFDNFNIYSMPGMGWVIGSDTHHIALKNSGVQRAPGSRNPFTTSRDGLHVMESQGNILLENCVFTGAGDDLVNIHDRCYAHKTTVTGARSLTLANYSNLQPLRVNNGDYLEFFNPDYTRLNGSSTPVTRQVQSTSLNGTTGVYTINFVTDLPTPLSTFAIIKNTRYSTTNVYIKGCTFINAGGHGILLSAAGATLENNTFSNIYHTALELEVNLINNIQSPINSWWEGNGATDVIIRSNYFDKVAQDPEFGGAAIYARPELPCGASYNTFFDRILVSNNTFDRITGPFLTLNNSSNVIAKDNQINYSEAPALLTNSYTGNLLAYRSTNLALGGNTWINRITNANFTGVAYNAGAVANAATNVVVSFLGGGAAETFDSYTPPSTFTSGQSLGAAGSGWTTGWKTSSSYCTTTGSVGTSPVLDYLNFLSGVITTQSGKTATSGGIMRPFNATTITYPFNLSFRVRTNTVPGNAMYVISDGQIASAAGGDSSSCFLIASINGTWQFYDGSNGGTSSYQDSGVPVTANGVYDFIVTVDPTNHTWRVALDNGAGYTVRSGLHARATTFATDTGTAAGGRWLIFVVREVVSGTSVGTTGNFSVDSVDVEY